MCADLRLRYKIVPGIKEEVGSEVPISWFRRTVYVLPDALQQSAGQSAVLRLCSAVIRV